MEVDGDGVVRHPSGGQIENREAGRLCNSSAEATYGEAQITKYLSDSRPSSTRNSKQMSTKIRKNEYGNWVSRQTDANQNDNCYAFGGASIPRGNPTSQVVANAS